MAHSPRSAVADEIAKRRTAEKPEMKTNARRAGKRVKITVHRIPGTEFCLRICGAPPLFADIGVLDEFHHRALGRAHVRTVSAFGAEGRTVILGQIKEIIFRGEGNHDRG